MMSDSDAAPAEAESEATSADHAAATGGAPAPPVPPSRRPTRQSGAVIEGAATVRAPRRGQPRK